MTQKTRLLAIAFAALVLLCGCGRSIAGQTSGRTAGDTTKPTTGTQSAQPPQDQGQQQDVMLPKDISKVEVTYKPAKPNPPTIERTLTDPAQIAKLVEAINAVPRGTIGFAHCVQDYGQQAQLKFYPTSGAPIVVSVVPSCSHVTIGNAPLLHDSEGIVWKAVQQVMGD